MLRCKNGVHPILMGRVIAGDAPFTASGHQAGDLGEHIGMDESALGMPRLGPRVGEHQKQAGDRLVR